MARGKSVTVTMPVTAAVTISVIAVVAVVPMTVAVIAVVAVATSVSAPVFAVFVLTIVVAVVVAVPAAAVAVVLGRAVEVMIVTPVTLVLTATGQVSTVAETGIEVTVNPTVKVARAAEPGTGADEDAVREPCGSVVAVGSASIRPVGEIAVRANRRGADVDGDGNPGGPGLRSGHKQDCGDHRESEKSDSLHSSSFLPESFTDAPVTGIGRKTAVPLQIRSVNSGNPCYLLLGCCGKTLKPRKN